MGFKSNARKKRQQSGADSSSKKSSEEFVGQVKCDVSGCKNWADKKVGGRKPVSYTHLTLPTKA